MRIQCSEKDRGSLLNENKIQEKERGKGDREGDGDGEGDREREMEREHAKAHTFKNKSHVHSVMVWEVSQGQICFVAPDNLNNFTDNC